MILQRLRSGVRTVACINKLQNVKFRNLINRRREPPENELELPENVLLGLENAAFQQLENEPPPNFFDVAIPTVSTLENNMTVISHPAPAPVLLLVAVKAGPRYEDPDDRGVCIYLNRHNQGVNTLRLVTERVGASFTFYVTRELLFYIVTCEEQNIPELMPYLGNAIGQGCPEVLIRSFDEEIIQQYNFHNSDPFMVAYSKLFNVAYREGIGNHVLHCPEHRLGRVTEKMLEKYISKRFTSNRIVFCALGLDHDAAIGCATQILCQNPATAEDRGTIYVGGDNIDVKEAMTDIHVAIATQSSGYENRKEYLSGKVLHEILGYDFEKSGMAAFGRLARVAPDVDYNVYALNHPYSDSGLFGFHVSALPQQILAVVDILINEMANLATKIRNDEVQVGKVRAVTRYQTTVVNDRENFAALLAMQAFLQLSNPAWVIYNPREDIGQLREVTKEDVENFARNTVRGFIAACTVGNFDKTTWPFFRGRLG